MLEEFIKGFGGGFFVGIALWCFAMVITMKSCSEDAYIRAHLNEACATFDAESSSKQLSPILCKKSDGRIILVRGKRGHYRISAEE